MLRLLMLTLTSWVVLGCQSAPQRPAHTVETVDIDAFMGSWFVVAHIPLWPERNAWNAVEHYERIGPERIQTTFMFRDGGLEEDLERYRPVAFLGNDGDDATWKMQFLWPFRADFRIVWLSEDYQHTIIGRKKRDYAWIMSRKPEMPAPVYEEMVQYLRAQGYPVEELRRVPQQWSGEPGYGLEASQPSE